MPRRITRDALTQALVENRAPEFLLTDGGMIAQIGSALVDCDTDESDIDLLGYCYPPEANMFHASAGFIPGFDQRFDLFTMFNTKENIENPPDIEFSIKNISVFFADTVAGNPKHIELLFADHCHFMRRDQAFDDLVAVRDAFINQFTLDRFIGSARQCLEVIKSGKRPRSAKRAALFDLYGYDVKTAYQGMRLLVEAEQLLVNREIDLPRQKSYYLEIINGCMIQDVFCTEFNDKLRSLNSRTQTLERRKPNREAKQVLMQALEAHYGSLAAYGYAVSTQSKQPTI